MSIQAVAHITDMVNQSSLAINGEDGSEALTVRALVASFYDVASDEVEDKLTELGREPRLVNFGVVSNLDRSLKAGDVVTMYTKAVADGGVKGAIALGAS